MSTNYTGNSFLFGLYATTPERRTIIEREVLLQKNMTKILNTLKKEPKAVIFLQKVTKKEAPNYFDVIKHPMDLGTMSKKLYLYKNMEEFKSDLDLIWSNCLTYNTVGEYYRDCAISMSELAENLCQTKERVYPRVLIPKQQNVEMTTVKPGEIYKYIGLYIKNAGFVEVNSRALSIIFERLNNEVKKAIKYHKKKL